MTIAKQILFYERDYYMFSNFSAFTVEYEGRLWPTAEHLYQAMKFMGANTNQAIVDEIFEARSAYKTKEIAYKKENRQYIRSDWFEIRVSEMEKVIRLKHKQHKFVQEKLAETGNSEIIENSPHDSF